MPGPLLDAAVALGVAGAAKPLAISALPHATVLPESVGFYIALMSLGFFIGGFGHLIRSRAMVAVGVVLIFLATLLLPLAQNILNDSPAPPGPNIYSP